MTGRLLKDNTSCKNLQKQNRSKGKGLSGFLGQMRVELPKGCAEGSTKGSTKVLPKFMDSMFQEKMMGILTNGLAIAFM